MGKDQNILITYQRTAITALGFTVFLIFVGGLVRVSGAGLGCPDWPKCFGSWMPPVSVASLPKSFDASQFNILKTWTEYVNRLTGITTGLLITATGILSIRYRNRRPAVFYSSSIAFGLVILEGWLGGSVVRSRLTEWIITAHLWLAIAIMLALIYAIFKSSERYWKIQIEDSKTNRKIFWIGLCLFGFIIVQTILGTAIRASVDGIVQSLPTLNRGSWLAHAGSIVKIHRSFSWFIFLFGIWLSYLAWWENKSPLLKKIVAWMIIAIILQIALGAGLYYMAMPPTIEVLHLLFDSILTGIVFFLILSVRPPVVEFYFLGKDSKSQLQ